MTHKKLRKTSPNEFSPPTIATKNHWHLASPLFNVGKRNVGKDAARSMSTKECQVWICFLTEISPEIRAGSARKPSWEIQTYNMYIYSGNSMIQPRFVVVFLHSVVLLMVEICFGDKFFLTCHHVCKMCQKWWLPKSLAFIFLFARSRFISLWKRLLRWRCGRMKVSLRYVGW